MGCGGIGAQQRRAAPAMGRGERTRERLRDAAENVFAANGFHGASVSAICRQAGVAQGTYYRYFSNKDDAFLLLVEQLERALMDRLQASLALGDRPEQRLLGVYRETLRFIDENVALYRVFREAEFIHSEIPKRFYHRICRHIADVIADGVSTGAFAASDPEVAAYAILGIILFLALRYVVWGETPALLPEAVEVGWQLIVSGIDPERRRSFADSFTFTGNRIRSSDPSIPTELGGSGESTRKALLDAAEQVFGLVGFSKASIASITYSAGVGQGTFYLHFPSKVAIFNELVRDISHRFRKDERVSLAPLDDRRAVECAGLVVFFEWIRHHQRLYRIVREAEFVDQGEIGRWYYRRLSEGYRSGLREGMDRGQIRSLEPEPLSYALLGIGHMSGQRWVLWADPRRSQASILNALFQLILCGLSTGDGVGASGHVPPGNEA
jgi:AcrR family transcriptional regulator